MARAVINDDLQAAAKFFESRDDARLTEIVAYHADLGRLVSQRLVEHFEDRIPRFEAHPRQSLIGLGMGRMEL
jgi:hypothetical protein